MYSTTGKKTILAMPANKTIGYNIITGFISPILLIVMAIALLCTLVAVAKTSIGGISVSRLAPSLLFQGSCLGVFAGMHFLLKAACTESIIVTRNQVIHRGVLLEGRPETRRSRKDLDHILWMREEDEFKNQSSQLFLVDHQSAGHLIMTRKSVDISSWEQRKWRMFIEKLSDASGLPVHIKTHRVEWDREHRKLKRIKLGESIEKWRLLPRTSTAVLCGKNRQTSSDEVDKS